ncbi:MAG: helix-turn-helix transcriptional regulator [Candidatus Dormibacteraeota bacterium]|uniref:Helix-turn-helix transcriptional regulator n=2 Tax=Candidatus Dormiibacter inghamiae TaxID=3127013 RepID=A0A934KGU0_9BACT|nr:helix-turn-helix transcriptional regulator [Candidatus Dormibacteraeota bacterium]
MGILQAAEDVFRERGYGAATMKAVADRAGVSLPTVYLYFGSKPALVRSLADRVTGSADLSVGRVIAETDPVRQLEIGAAILRNLHQRSEVVVDILRTAAGADPKLSREWRRWKDRHAEAVRAVAESLDANGALRNGVDPQAATDVLYTIGGPDTFRQLVRERGWNPSRYEKWLVEAGTSLLLRTT